MPDSKSTAFSTGIESQELGNWEGNKRHVGETGGRSKGEAQET